MNEERLSNLRSEKVQWFSNIVSHNQLYLQRSLANLETGPSVLTSLSSSLIEAVANRYFAESDDKKRWEARYLILAQGTCYDVSGEV
jgi:hypothetical protein